MTDIEKKWDKVKKENPQCLILFKFDDFHQAFKEDAYIVAGLLGLSIVEWKSKERKIPMVGFPNRLADGYIAKLVKSGHRVAICEEVK